MSWLSLMAGVFRSPAFRYVMIGVILLGLLLWQRHDAANGARTEAEAACREAVQTRVEIEQRRQMQIASDVLRRADARRRASQEESEARNETAQSIISHRQSSGDDRCLINADLRERLLAIY